MAALRGLRVQRLRVRSETEVLFVTGKSSISILGSDMSKEESEVLFVAEQGSRWNLKVARLLRLGLSIKQAGVISQRVYCSARQKITVFSFEKIPSMP
uniref:Uncharacterized protein n=1 Tax=Oryza meridionalis TaxID=40149 RepID=A0A0E0CRS4_9ORYZ